MKNLKLSLSICLLLITVGIYWQTVTYGFCIYDDLKFVVNNPEIQKGINVERIIWVFSNFSMSVWVPITTLSHMLDMQVFGSSAFGYHLVSISLHAINTVLVFILLMRVTSTLWRSFVVALLFAIHPLHVESATWISDRTDLISGLFFFLTLIVWERYVKKQTKASYFCAISFFALGLMSKPMLVTLPFILLLLDWYPFGRIQSRKSIVPLIVEKIPFLVLSTIVSIITFLAKQQADTLVSFTATPITLRLSNAVVSYGVYLRRMFWPNDLSIIYPYPTIIPWWQATTGGVLLISATMIFMWLRNRYPYLIVGWLWYLVMLIPVIGIIQVGTQAIADRYTYLPLIGPFIMIVWGISEATTTLARKAVVVVCTTIIMLALCLSTWRQLGYWKNNIALFTRASEISPDNCIARGLLSSAYINKGNELLEQWKFGEALQYFNIAATRSTGRLAATAYDNIGLTFAMQGKSEKAMQEYEKAIKHDPSLPDVYYNMGLLHLESGHRKEAATCFKEALRLNPEDDKSRRYLQDILQ